MGQLTSFIGIEYYRGRGTWHETFSGEWAHAYYTIYLWDMTLGDVKIVTKKGEKVVYRKQGVYLKYDGYQVDERDKHGNLADEDTEFKYGGQDVMGVFLDEAHTDVRLLTGFSNCETQNPVVVIEPRGGQGNLAKIYVKSTEEGEKIRKALVHLIKLSGGKEPVDENLFD